MTHPNQETERKWVAEAIRRLAELRTGHVKGIPADEVSEMARKRLEQ
jgi:hypothetical protein